MKILYIITRADQGGGQVHLLDLLERLPADITPILATGEEGFLTERAAQLGVPVHIASCLRQPLAPLHDVAGLFQLVRIIRREKPDLVHAHTSKAGLLGRFAAFLTRTPALFTAHTWSFADGIGALQQRIAVPLEKLAAKCGGHIITVSKSNAQQCLARAIAPGERVRTIWNGIPDVPERAEPGTNSTRNVLMVARFASQKDQLNLIHAMAGVAGSWRLQFAGDGPLRAECEAAARELGIASRVEFLRTRDDTAHLLAEADLFVLSTKWEGLPLSILEAMRAGLPVVASRVGGVAEAVTDGVTGFLTSPGDVHDLRFRIQQMIGSRELLSRMGAAGRKRFDRDFRIETMMQATLAAYREVTAESPALAALGEPSTSNL